MRIKNFDFHFVKGKFIMIRKFSLWHYLLGRKKNYCPKCDRIEYFTSGGMSIVGPSCTECGYNETMERIFNKAMKNL